MPNPVWAPVDPSNGANVTWAGPASDWTAQKASDAGKRAGEIIGNESSMTNATQAAAFVDPNAAANQARIDAGMTHTLQGFGAGGGSGNLAGLTHLGAVTNANAANIDQGQSQALMQGQVANINALNAQAHGQGPSVAEQQAKQLGEQNIAAQMAMAGSQRGSSNSALGMRAAQEQAAQTRQQAIQAGALGRSQEAMGAQQQLAGALGGATGQVQQGAQAQAGLQQQAGLQNAQAANTSTLQQGTMDQQTRLANMQAMLQAGSINMQQYNAMLQATLQQSNDQFQAAQQYANLATNENTAITGARLGVAAQTNAQNAGMQSATIGAGSAGFGALLSAANPPTTSDRRLKSHIKPGARSIKDFLSQLPKSEHGFVLMG